MEHHLVGQPRKAEFEEGGSGCPWDPLKKIWIPFKKRWDETNQSMICEVFYLLISKTFPKAVVVCFCTLSVN